MWNHLILCSLKVLCGVWKPNKNRRKWGKMPNKITFLLNFCQIKIQILSIKSQIKKLWKFNYDVKIRCIFSCDFFLCYQFKIFYEQGIRLSQWEWCAPRVVSDYHLLPLSVIFLIFFLWERDIMSRFIKLTLINDKSIYIYFFFLKAMSDRVHGWIFAFL